MALILFLAALASLIGMSIGLTIGLLARRPAQLLFAPLLAVTTTYPNTEAALYIGAAASIWAVASYGVMRLLTR